MSATTYYWCVNTCMHCMRSDRYVIGVLYDGHSFVAHDYPSEYGNKLPGIKTPVSSWSGWKKIVVRAPEDRSDPLYRVPWGHVEDGYGNVIPPDEFESLVEGLPGGIYIYDGFGEYRQQDVK